RIRPTNDDCGADGPGRTLRKSPGEVWRQAGGVHGHARRLRQLPGSDRARARPPTGTRRPVDAARGQIRPESLPAGPIPPPPARPPPPELLWQDGGRAGPRMVESVVRRTPVASREAAWSDSSIADTGLG